MAGKGSKNPQKWAYYCYDQIDISYIASDGGHRADAEKVKIKKAKMLLKKINQKLRLINYHISQTTKDRLFVMETLAYCTEIPHWMRSELHALELKMEEEYYEHNGKLIKKHASIREQDDLIRTLRRKMVHENSLAAEKRLIKEVKLAEETKANIVILTSGIAYEELQNRIKSIKAEIVSWRKKEKEMRARVEKSDKDLKWAEKELLKTEKMKNEVGNFILTESGFEHES